MPMPGNANLEGMNTTSTAMSKGSTTSVITDVHLGKWTIDPAHSAVTFAIRHLMSRVRGQFGDVEGHIEIGPTWQECSAEARIAAASINTGTQLRDNDLRSQRFFDVETYPTIAFSSSSIHERDRGIELTGDLTIRGVTLEVTLDTEFLGVDQTGLQGEARIGFTGRTTVHRSDFGVGSASIEANKVVVGDVVAVEIDIEAYLDRTPGGDEETVS